MRVQLRRRQIDWTESLRRDTGRRLHFALSRFSRRFSLVTVDIRHDTQQDLYSAIGRLADPAGRAVGRAPEQERNWAVSPLRPTATGGPRS